MQRTAAELNTHAAAAKHASTPASARASAVPVSSSGRSASSPRQSAFLPAEACLTTMNGTVSGGSRAKSSIRPVSCWYVSRALASATGSQVSRSTSLFGTAESLPPTARADQYSTCFGVPLAR